MKVKDLRNMTSEELTQKEVVLKKELYGLRFQRKIGRVEKPSQFRTIRQDIARILTVLNERKKDGNQSK